MRMATSTVIGKHNISVQKSFCALNPGFFINLWPWFAGFFTKSILVYFFFVSGQSFRLRRPRTMRQTIGSWMFLQVRLVSMTCPQDFSHLFLSRQALPKSFLCFAITWNLNFAVNLLTSFSRQKPLKSKYKKHRMFWHTKFYHPTKFEFKRIKYENVVPAVTQQQFRSKDTISHVVAWKFRGDVKRSKARMLHCTQCTGACNSGKKCVWVT